VQPPQILLVGNIVNGPSAADTNKLAPGLDLGGDPALYIFPQAALGDRTSYSGWSREATGCSEVK